MTTRMKLAVLGLFAAMTIAAASPYTHPRGADNAAGVYANCVMDKAEDLARSKQLLAATHDAAMSACVPLRAASLAWQSENFNASKERSQDDLDFTRCRAAGEYRAQAPFYVEGARECWNPRARHYEGVRPGERQDDLDFSNCRRVQEQRRRYDEGWECWNPRARHYEGVRPNERQDDLDFARCRPR